MKRQALLIGFGLAAAACSASPRAPATLDCHQGDGYEFLVLESYDATSTTAQPSWFGWGDSTPGSFTTMQPDGGGAFPTEPIENGGRCGSTDALVLRSSGHSDYGSGWGAWKFGDNSVILPIDASAYEGFSFWARSPGITDKSFTLALDDKTSSATPANVDLAGNQNCVIPDAGSGTNCSLDQTTGIITCGGTYLDVPHNACGNPFKTIVTTTDDWRLYLLPWHVFQQTADNRRQASGIDPATVFPLNITVPKEARMELWLDDLGFYRRARGGGTD